MQLSSGDTSFVRIRTLEIAEEKQPQAAALQNFAKKLAVPFFTQALTIHYDHLGRPNRAPGGPSTMTNSYVHGYDPRESTRLQDQAKTLDELLHGNTAYPEGSHVLEAGCGVGAQTHILAKRSPGARFTSVDISPSSLAQARAEIEQRGFDQRHLSRRRHFQSTL